jgi:hypothetical protein
MRHRDTSISAKPDGVGAGSQLSIFKGERFGLLTLTETTESVSMCMLVRFDHIARKSR